MNPSKPITLDNLIPQCQICNQAYQDDFVFDIKGRVVAVASVKPVFKKPKKKYKMKYSKNYKNYKKEMFLE